MIQKINKGSDLLIVLDLKDMNDVPYRVSDLNQFIIRFFTSNQDNYIEASYIDGVCNSITIKEDGDYVSLNASDLIKLDSGILNYTYSIRIQDSSFADGYYDEVIKGQTELYIKSNCSCNECI